MRFISVVGGLALASTALAKELPKNMDRAAGQLPHNLD